MDTVFGNVIEFLARLGVFEILLPFILVFAIVFAIMEKTKVLGTEKIGDVEIPRRNINSLVAFCVAFFVVASSSLVATINQALAHITLLLLISVFYLILIGSFHEQGKPIFLDGHWRTGGMIAMLVGILLIFANAIPTRTGVSWLEFAYDYVIRNADGTVVGTFLFILIIIIFVAVVTKSPKPAAKSKSGGD